MRGALDVHRDLLARGVAHEIVRLRGTRVVSADELPDALGVDRASCLAVRCYVTDVGIAAVMVQAGALPQPEAVLDTLGARTLRAATSDEVNAATDYAAGLVSPLCLPPGVLLLADAGLGAREVLYCPVGEGGVALGIRTVDLLEASGAVVASLTSSRAPRPTGEPWSGGARVMDLDARATTRRGHRSAG